MNLASVDLNLLVAFDALLRERNVSRAAARVGLAQPSMSNALSRLRALLDDELFVRTPRGMEPTAKALALAEPVQSALAEIGRALDPGEAFDPRRTHRSFTIGAADFVEFILIPPLLELLRREAPGADLRIRAFDRRNVFDLLDRGELDLALGVFPELPKRFRKARVLEERFVCLARAGHPELGKGLDVESFTRLPHILVSPRGDPTGVADRILARMGRKRRVAVTVANFLSLPFVVGASDLLGIAGERIAERLAAPAGVELHPLPIALRGFTLSMIWGAGSQRDPACDWLRSKLREVARDL